MSVANLISQINSNFYLKKALVNPLLNSNVAATEDDAMFILSLHSEEDLQRKVDYMLNQISIAEQNGDTDALFRLEHNLRMIGDVLYNFDGTKFVGVSTT